MIVEPAATSNTQSVSINEASDDVSNFIDTQTEEEDT